MIWRVLIAATIAWFSIQPAQAQSPFADRRSGSTHFLCDKMSLSQALSSNEAWYRMIRIKRRHGYLPPASQRAEIERRTRADTERLTGMLRRYEDDRGALALVYGSEIDPGWRRDVPSFVSGDDASPARRIRVAPGQSCVWLVGPDGIRASGLASSDWQDAAPRLWDGLEVTARSRSPGTVRAPGGDCPVFADPPMGQEAPALQDDSFIAQTREALEKASSTLIPPAIERHLAMAAGRDTRLMIFTRGNLRKVPFAALQAGSDLLVEGFVPVIVPSIEALPEKANRTAPGRAELVVGNPDLSGDRDMCWTPLPAAEREARRVAAVGGTGDALIGADANRDAVMQRLESGKALDLIYLATHGVSDPVDPADGSFLALAGGHLRGADLRDITLEGDPLVVLSACQTGLGKDFDDGVFGLPEAWHFAGASRIVMSLWNVDDAGTETLMAGFVERLAATGWQDADLALARAMRTMRSENSDPMIWAAFSFYGRP